jgi:hypothetical protein
MSPSGQTYSNLTSKFYKQRLGPGKTTEMSSQRKILVRTEQESGHLQARKRGLKGNQPDSTWSLNFHPPEIVRK